MSKEFAVPLCCHVAARCLGVVITYDAVYLNWFMDVYTNV